MRNKPEIPRLRIWFGWPLVGLALLALSGCAAGTAVKKEKTAQTLQEKTGPMGATVVRLENGREGFVITETVSVDDAVLAEFENAAAMLGSQNYSGAVDLLEKVIEKSPNVTAPHLNIAIAYDHLDKPKKAEEHLKIVLDIVPGHPVACLHYGLLCRKGGRFKEAREVYEQALAAFPEYYPIHKNLGILCDLYMNDLGCAMEHYETYSAEMPGDEQVKLWIADLRTRIGSSKQ